MADVLCCGAGEGHYTEAVQAYRNAGDFESVIRLYLGPLQKVREAADLAKHSGKPQVLAMVAGARLEAGDYQARAHLLSAARKCIWMCSQAGRTALRVALTWACWCPACPAVAEHMCSLQAA